MRTYNSIQEMMHSVDKAHTLDDLIDLTQTDNDGNTFLHAISSIGRMDLLEEWCEQFDNVDLYNNHIESPLMFALMHGRASSMEFLIASGALINTLSREGENVLHYAVRGGNEECIERILELGVDINLADDIGCTPLFLAAASRNKPMYDLLLELGANPNTACKNGGWTPAMMMELKLGS